ncbi:hypothetical protein BC829DRAFT_448543 [Chytridium lagenaria]|nr:hypothetical protein BC829DRAFT_448543 [Chytridium lagenaria]
MLPDLVGQHVLSHKRQYKARTIADLELNRDDVTIDQSQDYGYDVDRVNDVEGCDEGLMDNDENIDFNGRDAIEYEEAREDFIHENMDFDGVTYLEIERFLDNDEDLEDAKDLFQVEGNMNVPIDDSMDVKAVWDSIKGNEEVQSMVRLYIMVIKNKLMHKAYHAMVNLLEGNAAQKQHIVPYLPLSTVVRVWLSSPV